MPKTKGNQKETKKKPNKTKKTKKEFKLEWNNPLIVALIVLLVLAVISYLTLGLIVTVILILGILMIFGIARLLDKTKSKKRQRRILNIILITGLTLGILGCVAVGGFFVYVVKQAPKFEIERLSKKESTIIYDINGNEFAKLGTEMRENISYDDLPQVLIDAIVATEDSRFFQHNGFDAPRFIKASLGQVAGQDAGGASTLSMQVIKNSFTDTTDQGFEGIVRKFTDIYLAIFKLEKNYTKEQIIEFYVNNHFLGGNVWGVEQASQTYFGKSVSDLNLSEAAIIAGMFQSPNYYRPDTKPENAEKRRNTVLYLMNKHGYISKEEWEMAKSIPVSSLTGGRIQANSEFQGYIDTIVEELDEKYGVNPYVTPLLIYSNMDRSKQQGVNRVLSGEVFNWKDDLVQSGVAVLDVHSGKILAVGTGRNKEGKGVNIWNLATQMKKQPGSTAKPLFDYGPGIEYNNWSTYTLFDDEPYSYTTGQTLNNWDGQYMGSLTLRQALSLSRNVPALKAFQQVDNKKILSFVESLGIKPEAENGRLHEAHSIGAFTGVSPLEMAAAYQAFANGGYYYEPLSVNKFVYRGTGETVEQQSEKVKVMSDSTAYMITSVLQDVPNSRSDVAGVNIAAKTGTTNYDENKAKALGLAWDAINDSWTVGYNPDIVIGMWYGYEELNQELANQGYYNHLDEAAIKRDYLFHAYANQIFPKDNKDFTMPSSVVKVGIEKGSNPAALASESTPPEEIVYEYFKAGTEPTEASPKYQKLETPSNIRVTYHEKENQVSISWNQVAKTGYKEEYGKLLYDVYFDNKLLGSTDKITYSISKPKTPYGTYKIVARYEKYDGNKSNEGIFEFKKPSTETNDPKPDDNKDPIPDDNKNQITSELINKSLSLKVGDIFKMPMGRSAVIIKENGVDVTAQATITGRLEDSSGNSIATIDTSTTGTYSIAYDIKYKTYQKTLRLSVTVTN